MGPHDPLRVMWDALEAADCDPQGLDWKFRARCPTSVHQGHVGRNLCVSEGADGRAVFFCQSHQCDGREILDALGLRWSDTFPDGHHNAGDRSTPPKTALDVLLDGLGVIGIPWRPTTNPRFWLADGCPACDSKTLWIHRVSKRKVQLSCWNGCESERIRRSITTRAVAR